ncbi:hypothetical protein MC885_010654 [Smutsia gigantea]|nr:hypothetical protein MC885_010654 [Smutsia gigantea]
MTLATQTATAGSM